MRKDLFYYNKQTLRYEKLVEPLRIKILRIVGMISVVLIVAGIFAVLMDKYLPSPKEEAQRREIQQMELLYTSLSDEVSKMSKVLGNVQERDAGVHRMIFGMEPINQDVWEGGVGGSEKYDFLTNFDNSGEYLRETLEKVDKLKLQLATQSKSLDEIEEKAQQKEERLASVPAIKPVRGDKLKRNITALSGFGMRNHPIHKIKKMHTGIDFTAPTGTLIQATGNGKVVKVLHKRTGYGTHVVIDHGFGYQTLYGHMSSVSVKVGQKVVRGQNIGKVGNTGTSTAPHLHYEVHHLGKKVNPLHYCLDGLSPEEYQKLANMASVTNQSFD